MPTLTDNQKLELIEKHLSGTLSPREQAVFQQLMDEEEDFALAVLFQKDLMPSIAANGRQALKQQFQDLEKKLSSSSTSKASVFDSLKQSIEAEINQLGYTIEQLMERFSPLPNYTVAIAATTRGSSISLIAPQNDADFSEGWIGFDFGKPLKKELEVLIEDNQYDILIEEEINIGQTEARFPIPSDDFPPGRYYWKLIEEDELALIGTFFIRKDLMESLKNTE